MYEYEKQLADFTALVTEIDMDKLQDAVWSESNIATLFHGARAISDYATIYFVFENEPSSAEKIEIDNITAAHVGVAEALNALDSTIYEAKLNLDKRAGVARARYITVAEGQDGTYLLKAQDAQAYKDAGYPADLTPYPFVAGELAAITPVDPPATAAQVADSILTMAAQWKPLAAYIEQVRLTYKNQIAVATTVDGVTALRNKAGAILDAI